MIVPCTDPHGHPGLEAMAPFLLALFSGNILAPETAFSKAWTPGFKNLRLSARFFHEALMMTGLAIYKQLDPFFSTRNCQFIITHCEQVPGENDMRASYALKFVITSRHEVAFNAHAVLKTP